MCSIVSNFAEVEFVLSYGVKINRLESIWIMVNNGTIYCDANLFDFG